MVCIKLRSVRCPSHGTSHDRPPLIPDPHSAGRPTKILYVLTDGPEGTLNRLDRGPETDDSEKRRPAFNDRFSA